MLARLAFRMRDCFGLLWPEVVVVDFARPDVDFVDQSRWKLHFVVVVC